MFGPRPSCPILPDALGMLSRRMPTCEILRATTKNVVPE